MKNRDKRPAYTLVNMACLNDLKMARAEGRYMLSYIA